MVTVGPALAAALSSRVDPIGKWATIPAAVPGASREAPDQGGAVPAEWAGACPKRGAGPS